MKDKSQASANNPLPDRLLRLPHVLQIVPISKSTWWAGVRSGKFPKPVKLGPRTTCWRQSDIAAFVENSCRRSDAAKPPKTEV